MSLNKKVCVSGYCDYLGNEHQIIATYAKINILGDSNSYAKITSYECDYVEECNLDRECPLYKIASQRTHW